MSDRYPRYRVSGDATTRSTQYGRIAHAEIRRTRDGYEQAFAAKGVSWGDAVAFSLGFVPAIQKAFPELLREMHGIAEGAGIPFADILTMNCRTEVLWRAAVAREHSLTGGPRGECSSFALEPDRTALGRPLVGQNWDWLEVLADGVIVLEVERPDAPNFVTIVEAGLLAKTTMNQAGVTIGINTIVSSLDGGSEGVPFHVLVRAVADAEHVSDVVGILASVRRASSGNYIVAAENGAVLNIETAPGDSRTVHPLIAGDGAVVHTNHFVRAPAGGHDLAPAQMSDSFVRYGRLERLIGRHRAPLTLSDLQSALADHVDAPSAICCHPDLRDAPAARWATLASVVMDPTARILHFAEGSPCTRAWSACDYSVFLAPAGAAPAPSA